jgi:uncharacterized protein with HEPN domain
MLDYSREAIAFVAGRTREDLDRDRLLNLALVRLLEVIGEAAGRIPPEERERYPQIQWRGILGLRNRLIHGYDSVDLELLWRIVREDLPALVAALATIISRET